MPLTEIPPQSLPLVYTVPGSPVHDLVAAARDQASDEMARALWADFRAELMSRLEALGQGGLGRSELAAELHAIRGSSSQFGLFLLEVFLFAWEKKEPDPAEAAGRYLPGALAIAGLSVDAIEKEFPHLKSPRG